VFDLKLKRPGPTFYHLLIFIISQFTWFLLLGLWIYWYVSNYILLNKIDEKLNLDTFPGDLNVFTLVSGLILLVLLSVGMSWIFVYLTKQLNVTRLYDNFIANVTHELKSPLSSIQMYVETMRKRKLPAKEQAEFLEMMQQDTERLGRLINSILYLSSLENTKMAKTVQHDYNIFNADSIIRDIISELQMEFKLDNDTIAIEGTAMCECVIDRDWLKIVLSNLLDNAIKYCIDKPAIVICLSKDLKYFYIQIIDNGVGIQPRDQKKIFNKFQRIHNPESPNVKGTGLGLYWVKEIITRHGGKISVESMGTNTGTTFKIALPIYKTSKQRYINRLLKRSRKQTERSSEL
jgi:two-component system, OmpR family, phosphate regulon sensor histidine kinase PhoR